MKISILLIFLSMTMLSSGQTKIEKECGDKLLDSISLYSLTEKWKAADNIKLYNPHKQVKYSFNQTESGLTIHQYIYNCDGILIRIAIFKNGKYYSDAAIEE